MTYFPRRVAIYCGSATGVDPAYADAVLELVEKLAARNIGVVYGGGKIGLMGVLGDAAVRNSLDIIGVIPVGLLQREIAHPELSQLEVVETMAQRKTRMEELADAFIALPGGMGTLEELCEVLTLQQLGEIAGPVVLYNVAGFWTPLLDALHSMHAAGFIPQKYLDALIVVDNPEDMFQAFADWVTPGTKWR